MKKLIIIIAILTSTMSFAQTKKIAWRSHSGNLTTFIIDSPDDFGMVMPDYYRPRIKEIEMPPLKVRELNNEDKLLQCPLIPDSLMQINLILPKPTIKEEPKVEKKKDTIIYAQVFSVNQATTFPNLEYKSNRKSTKQSESSSPLGWLGLLLLLPSGLVWFKHK